MLRKVVLIAFLSTSIIVNLPVFAQLTGQFDQEDIITPLIQPVIDGTSNEIDDENDVTLSHPHQQQQPPPPASLIANHLFLTPGRWLLIERPIDPFDTKKASTFTPWAGKRSFEETKKIFHSWAGKRSTKPFSNWAGKRMNY